MKQRQVASPKKAVSVEKPVKVYKPDKDPNPGASRIVATAPKKAARYVDFSAILEGHKPTTQILDRVKAATAKKQSFNETITSEAALDLLTLNQDNRKLKRASIDKMVEDMLADIWIWNGDPIRFDINMKLVDGQHRLWAIYLSKRKQPYTIVTGLPEKAQSTIDNGQNRNASDALQFHGFKEYSTIVAAVIKAYDQWEKSQTVHARNHRYVFSPADVLNWAIANKAEAEKINEFAGYAVKTLFKDAPFFKASQWAFIYFLLWSLPHRQAKAKDFITKLALASGISETENSAIWVGRRMIARIDKDTSGNSHQLYTWKMKHLIKAWNLWIEGKEMATEKSFKFTTGEKDNTVIEKPL